MVNGAHREFLKEKMDGNVLEAGHVEQQCDP